MRLIVGLLGASLWLGGAQSSAAAQRRPRPGVRVQYASVGSEGGLRGRAFLLVSRSGTRLCEPPASCPEGTRVVRALARVNRGFVREIQLTLTARDPATVPITARGCERAEVTLVLSDGRRIDGGEGSVQIDELTAVPGGEVRGTFTYTASHEGDPLAIRGEFRVPIPPRRQVR